jgi:hypothetical protein
MQCAGDLAAALFAGFFTNRTDVVKTEKLFAKSKSAIKRRT